MKCELGEVARECTPFRAAERLYRRRDPKASTPADQAQLRASLIDFGAAEGARVMAGSEAAARARPDEPLALGGGRFTLRDYDPGLVVIPGALSPREQAELVALALRAWSYEPWGRSNLGTLARPRAPADLPPSNLSWVTVGWHYQWTERAYDAAQRGPFPPRLAELCAPLCPAGFRAEAAIVKRYDERATMLAHVDDAEEAVHAPVLSLSLGCDAIFLLGGTSRDDGPVLPILLRSGDALLLGGKARLCYHGLVRVYPHTLPAHFSEPAPRPPAEGGADRAPPAATEGDEACASSVSLSAAELDWLENHRININVRQVKP
jgi:alkylated DNA repair protein alkB family protein 1